MCFTPIRYAWDLQNQYLQESGLSRGLKSLAVRWLLHKVRLWDVRSAKGVDRFIAISHFIARRIQKAYRRESVVIYPPVDTDHFEFQAIKGDFYITASRMVPYKKIPLIIEAFSRMPDKKLIVVGSGPEFAKCQKLATSNVTLLGHQSAEILKDYLQRAKAFVFAAEEDFGIAPIEAQACGTPVVATSGGATDDFLAGERYYPIESVLKENTSLKDHLPVNAYMEPNADHLFAVLTQLGRKRAMIGTVQRLTWADVCRQLISTFQTPN
jgi:glycosyltransferase involved in cell wall biosynthesis